MFSRNFISKNLMMTKNQFTPVVKRTFSQSIKPPQASNTGLYMLGGIGLAGIAMTCLKGRSMSMQ